MCIVKKREEEIKVIPTLSLWKCKTCKTRRLENCIMETSWTVGMAMGRGGAKGWDLRPRPAWIFLAPSPPRPA